MIAFGFLTRFALLVRLPVLIGAVFIVNTRNSLTLSNMELRVSAAILALMLFFLIVGPG